MPKRTKAVFNLFNVSILTHVTWKCQFTFKHNRFCALWGNDSVLYINKQRGLLFEKIVKIHFLFPGIFNKNFKLAYNITGF